MNSVERVIFDVLARRGSVALPGVGSLEVKRRKAHRVSETRVIPPQNVVVFSRDEPREVPSVVDLLNRGAGMSMDDAWASYNGWIEQARDGDALIIEGAGTLRGERFEPTDSLHEMLNPTGAGEDDGTGYASTAAPIADRHETHSAAGYDEGYDRPRRQGRRKGLGAWWVLIVLGALALAFAVASLLCPDFYSDLMDGLTGKKARTEVVAPPPVPVVDTVTVAEPLAPVATGPVYHVIAGAFLEPGNAEKRMTELRRDYPEFKVQKIQNPNGFEMVSIFSSADRAAAQRELNRHLDLDPCGWIYMQ